MNLNLMLSPSWMHYEVPDASVRLPTFFFGLRTRSVHPHLDLGTASNALICVNTLPDVHVIARARGRFLDPYQRGDARSVISRAMPATASPAALPIAR